MPTTFFTKKNPTTILGKLDLSFPKYPDLKTFLNYIMQNHIQHTFHRGLTATGLTKWSCWFFFSIGDLFVNNGLFWAKLVSLKHDG